MNQPPDQNERNRTSQCLRCGRPTAATDQPDRTINGAVFVDYACKCGHSWSLVGATIHD